MRTLIVSVGPTNDQPIQTSNLVAIRNRLMPEINKLYEEGLLANPITITIKEHDDEQRAEP